MTSEQYNRILSHMLIAGFSLIASLAVIIINIENDRPSIWIIATGFFLFAVFNMCYGLWLDKQSQNKTQ